MDIDAIKAMVSKVGDWYIEGDTVDVRGDKYVYLLKTSVPDYRGRDSYVTTRTLPGVSERYHEFIAAAPRIVRELVSEVEQMRQALLLIESECQHADTSGEYDPATKEILTISQNALGSKYPSEAAMMACRDESIEAWDEVARLKALLKERGK